MSNIIVLSGSVRKGGDTELFDSIKIQYQLVVNFFKLEDAGMVLVRESKCLLGFSGRHLFFCGGEI